MDLRLVIMQCAGLPPRDPSSDDRNDQHHATLGHSSSVATCPRECPDLVAEATADYQLLMEAVVDGETAGALPPSAPPLSISALLCPLRSVSKEHGALPSRRTTAGRCCRFGRLRIVGHFIAGGLRGVCGPGGEGLWDGCRRVC